MTDYNADEYQTPHERFDGDWGPEGFRCAGADWSLDCDNTADIGLLTMCLCGGKLLRYSDDGQREVFEFEQHSYAQMCLDCLDEHIQDVWYENNGGNPRDIVAIIGPLG